VGTLAFIGGSISAGALCLTCLGTYLLVAGFAVWWPGRAARRARSKLGRVARAIGLPATVAAVMWIALLVKGRDSEPRFVAIPSAAQASPTPASITQYLASRPNSEKQALSDLLARFARTPAPAAPLPPPRALRGPPDAPVHLVEWTDLLCPHCRRLNETLDQLRQSIPPDRLSIEARQYPLDGRCNPGVPQKGDGLRCDGALVQICLEKAPDYWTLRDKLFAAQRTLTRESMMDIASSGLTPRSQLEACMASDEAKARLADDIRYADLYHPTGTPLVAINGKEAQPVPMFLYALAMASGDPTAPLLTSALPRHATPPRSERKKQPPPAPPVRSPPRRCSRRATRFAASGAGSRRLRAPVSARRPAAGGGSLRAQGSGRQGGDGHRAAPALHLRALGVAPGPEAVPRLRRDDRGRGAGAAG
jgi:serine/threonine-protein kinase